MSLHKEISFENEICNHLCSAGWIYEHGAATRYDRGRALFPEDLRAWLNDTQPKVWEALEKTHGAAALDVLGDRLRKQLDDRGTLDVLRHGLELIGVRGLVSLAQFAPVSGMNPEIIARYEANRVRVIRQLRYSRANENCIDLALFLNGIPVATVELKTDFTQSIGDAMDQYRFDRNPRNEPLLTFARGALVHFAVSNREVMMTTKLEGGSTRFLPFNQGNLGGAGNPVHPTGHSTGYLWEQIWQRDSWLELIGRYMIAKRDKKKQISAVIFPRYHQLDATRKLREQVRTEGAGGRFLIQHSAGSGKTNSIAWAAHFLADLHDANDQKVFSSVIVVSDRNVIDAQLQEALFEFERTKGVVATITNEGGSKSAALTEASAHLNPTLNGRDIRAAFKDDDCKLLLVANKFQTGFDQPLLCGMYVDRRLAGIQAVQTLSRLNRAHPGKDTTYILDFVNSSEEILTAFRQYYETAEIEAATDPNLVYDLRQKLDRQGYYDQFEIDRLVAVELDSSATQGQLIAAIEPIAQRMLTLFNVARERHRGAIDRKDKDGATEAKEEMEALLQARGDMAAFIRIYAFLSQIFDYGSTEIEKRYMFYKRLVPLLQFGRERDAVDLSGVKLTHHSLKDQGARQLRLSDDKVPLPAITGVGSGSVQDKEKALLAEILAKVNDLFEGELTDADQLIYVNNVIKGKLLESEELRAQAMNNSKTQFANSPTLADELVNAIIDAMTAHETMSRQALSSAKVRDGLRDVLLGPGQLYEELRKGAE